MAIINNCMMGVIFYWEYETPILNSLWHIGLYDMINVAYIQLSKQIII